MTSRIGPIVLALALSGVAVLGFAAPAPVGEECAACHEDVVKAFGKTAHGKTFAGNTAYQSASCVSCHVDAREHAASPGDKKPVSLTKGSQADAPCLSCHAGKPNQAHWQGSAHQMAELACASCHGVHGDHGGTPEENKTPGPTAVTTKCLQCHVAQRVALHQRSSHPMQDGQMECTSCHNPHGTSGEKLLKQATVNELCYSCHQNMRGPFLWEHSPVREDCLTCHKAHGSNYPQMLQARVTQLCQSCHQQGRHQT
ncbi:MAG: DmsE family decaheme c-type cytochrome, partial [Acidobacteriota bacterium]